jgi:hypothetical protein
MLWLFVCRLYFSRLFSFMRRSGSFSR